MTGAAKSRFQSEGVLVSSVERPEDRRDGAHGPAATAGSAQWWACGKRVIPKEKGMKLVSFRKAALSGLLLGRVKA